MAVESHGRTELSNLGLNDQSIQHGIDQRGGEFLEVSPDLIEVSDRLSKLVELLKRRDMRFLLNRFKNRNLPEISRLRVGEYKRFLNEIHACIIRGGIGWHCRQQAYVILRGSKKTQYTYQSPHFDDRDFLIQKMLDAARTIPSLKDVGLLLYVLTNILHGFQDGNGRMARLLYGLMNDLPESELDELLSHGGVSGGRAIMGRYVKNQMDIDGMIIQDMTPQYCNGYLQVTGSLNPVDVDDFNHASLEREIKDDLQVMLGEERRGTLMQYQIRDLILFAFKVAHPEISVYSYEESSGEGLIYFFDAQQLIDSLSPQQAVEMLEIGRRIRKEFALHAIDIIENPHRHTSVNGKPLKDDWCIYR